MNENQITYFAKTNFRNQERKFGIKLDDRRRHTYVIGKTGVGKTEVLKNMAIQDVQNGHGLAFVDPHGDSVEELLEYVSPNRINDVVYFNPADLDYPIAFNILENVDPEYKHLVADGLMGVFTKIWANMWSARMEYILRNCVLALLDVPGNTLLGVMRLLVDKDFRKKIVDKIKDPVVKTFWIDEYANYNDRFRIEAIAPIQNKVGQFLSSGIIRNIVGQTKSTIDPRQIMDDGKMLFMNLAKGKIGEDNSNLLGAMMITKLQLAAMSRADTPEKDRRDFFLYVDEFQNFATESFADIMSEARKYRLNLIIGHQYIAQLTTNESTKVRDAVFGNVGTIICFRIGAADAYFLIKEFEPYFVEEDLVNLNKYDIYLKLMIDGTASKPFSATTLPPMSEGKQSTKNKEKVIKVSRERYTHPKEEVEDKIVRWLQLDEMFQKQAGDVKVEGGNVMYKAGVTAEKIDAKRKGAKHTDDARMRADSPDVKKEDGVKSASVDKPPIQDDRLEAVCDNCSAITHLSFVPQAHLNVFCKNCLKKFKKGEIDTTKLPLRNKDLAEKNKARLEKEQKKKNADNALMRADSPDIKKEDSVKSLEATAENDKINFLAADKGDVQQEKEEVSLNDLNKQQPTTFKGSGGRSVQPGQQIKL